jgi:hypothetical protein
MCSILTVNLSNGIVEGFGTVMSFEKRVCHADLDFRLQLKEYAEYCDLAREAPSAWTAALLKASFYPPMTWACARAAFCCFERGTA